MDEVTARIYQRFGAIETPALSPCYSRLSLGISTDPAVVDLIAELPRPKRQANLLFGASRYLGAALDAYPPFRAWLLANWAAVREVMLTRSTQTNEAGRCALYLPTLNGLPQPLALIEVGAAAGLCLHPDKYSYRYATPSGPVALDPDDGPSEVTIDCTIDTAAPARLPEVAWRAGVDLNPLDPSEPDTLAWLDALIWPEHEQRRRRLGAAARIAAADPVPIVAGDLVEQIVGLVDSAPGGTTVVVFHTAVLVYLEPERRQQFAAQMMDDPRVTWVSNEGAGVLPEITSQVEAPSVDGMILAVNGRAVAQTRPHGDGYRML